MHRNTAEMRSSKSPMDIGISAEKNAAKLEHRFAVAPMMDWTDCPRSRFSIKALGCSRAPCLLYVSSNGKYCRRTCPGLPGVDRAHRDGRACSRPAGASRPHLELNTRACASRRWTGEEGEGESQGPLAERRSSGFLLRRREATFPFSSIGADSAAAAFPEAFAMTGSVTLPYKAQIANVLH